MKKQNGITMISLIITIIVMVILAGVAISMAVGDDSVITKSKAGVSSSNFEQVQEEIRRAWGDLEMGFWMDTNTVKRSEYFTAENLQNALGVGEIKDFIYNPGGVTTGIYVKNNEEYEFSIDTSNHTDVTTNDFGTTTGGYGEGAGTNDNINNNTTEEYKLSGIWKFNDSVNITGDLGYEEVNFTSNGTNYAGMVVSYNGSDDIWIVYIMSNSSGQIIAWNNSQWDSENVKTLDFGSEAQTVSEEFYNWFVANATQGEATSDDDITVENALSGAWKFNETIDMSGFDWFEEVDFTSNGVNYVGLYMSYNGDSDQSITYFDNIVESDPSLTNNVTVWKDSSQWSNDAYRTMNFGTTLQEVSEEFYNWFTVNATKQ